MITRERPPFLIPVVFVYEKLKFLEIIDYAQFVDLIKSKTKSIFFSTIPNTQ